MKVFAAGCIHGYWMKLYQEVVKKKDVDLVIVNGDATTFRTMEDLQSTTHYKEALSISKKKKIFGKRREQNIEELFGTFNLFYKGELKFPCMVIIISGNNENADQLFKLPFGGFVAPNIFYLGRAGIIDFNGIRISGISGITDDKFARNVDEVFPIRESDVYSSYATRSFSPFQVYMYSLFKETIDSPNPDILMTHDWPSGAAIEFESIIPEHRYRLIEGDKKGEFGNKFGSLLIDSLHPFITTAAHHHLQLNGKFKDTNFFAMSRPEKKYWYSMLEINPDKNKPKDGAIRFAREWVAIVKATVDYMKNPSLCSNINLWEEEKNKIAEKTISALNEVGKDLIVPPFNEDTDATTNEICKMFNIENPFA